VRLVGPLLCLFFLLWPLSATSEPAPRFGVESYEYNFGSVSQGTTVEHRFEFKNSGGGHLVIQRIVPACGCTASTLDSEVFASGESGMLQVKFDTSGFSGEKVKTFRVYTNDPSQSSLVLSLRGIVEPEVVVEPRRVFFGDVISGEGGSRDVTVRVREGSSVQIRNVQLHSNNFTIQEIEAGSNYRVMRVTLQPEVRPGEVRERIVVGLRGDKRQSVNIPIYASIKGPIQMNPASLSYGILEGQEPLLRRVRIENLGKSDFEITQIDSRHKSIKVEKRTVQPGRIYELEVSLDPSSVQRELRSAIEITTNHPDQKRLSLSVYGSAPPTP